MSADDINFKVTGDASGYKKAVSDAKRQTDKLGRQGKEAGQDISKGMNKAERATDEYSRSANKASKVTGDFGVQMLGLFDATANVNEQFAGFKEKIVALEKSQFDLTQTQKDAKRQQEDLAKLAKTAGKNSREYKRALEDLRDIQKQLAIEQREVKAEQQALHSEFVGFGISLAQTGVFGFSTLKTLFPNLTLSLGGMRTALLGAAGGMRALTAASWAFIRTPVGKIALAAAAGIAVYESNLFGAKDALDKLVGFELPTFTGMLDELNKKIMPETSAQVRQFADVTDKDLAAAMNNARVQAAGLSTTMDPTLANSMKNTAKVMAGPDGVVDQFTKAQNALLGSKDAAKQAKREFDGLLPSLTNLNSAINTFFGAGGGVGTPTGKKKDKDSKTTKTGFPGSGSSIESSALNLERAMVQARKFSDAAKLSSSKTRKKTPTPTVSSVIPRSNFEAIKLPFPGALEGFRPATGPGVPPFLNRQIQRKDALLNIRISIFGRGGSEALQQEIKEVASNPFLTDSEREQLIRRANSLESLAEQVLGPVPIDLKAAKSRRSNARLQAQLLERRAERRRLNTFKNLAGVQSGQLRKLLGLTARAVGDPARIESKLHVGRGFSGFRPTVVGGQVSGSFGLATNAAAGVLSFLEGDVDKFKQTLSNVAEIFNTTRDKFLNRTRETAVDIAKRVVKGLALDVPADKVRQFTLEQLRTIGEFGKFEDFRTASFLGLGATQTGILKKVGVFDFFRDFAEKQRKAIERAEKEKKRMREQRIQDTAEIFGISKSEAAKIAGIPRVQKIVAFGGKQTFRKARDLDISLEQFQKFGSIARIQKARQRQQFFEKGLGGDIPLVQDLLDDRALLDTLNDRQAFLNKDRLELSGTVS